MSQKKLFVFISIVMMGDGGGAGDVLDFGLDTPVPANVLERRVLIELSRVPAAHLVVALELGVLHPLLGEHISRLGHEILADPRRDLPVALWDHL